MEMGAGDLQRLHDDDIIVERNCDSEREGLHQRERGEEEEVPWMRVALPVEQAQVDERAEEGNVECPGAARLMNISLVGSCSRAVRTWPVPMRWRSRIGRDHLRRLSLQPTEERMSG